MAYCNTLSPARYGLYESHKTGFQDAATKQLVGCVVLTRYVPPSHDCHVTSHATLTHWWSRYNNRTYRIDDIAWDKNPLSTFMDHTGKAVSFVDYYK